VIFLIAGGALAAAIMVLFSILVLKISQARRASKTPHCYYCGSVALHLSAPGGIADKLLRNWNCMPHRCEICFRRQYRFAGEPQRND
jgi:hypothetical protein